MYLHIVFHIILLVFFEKVKKEKWKKKIALEQKDQVINISFHRKLLKPSICLLRLLKKKKKSCVILNKAFFLYGFLIFFFFKTWKLKLNKPNRQDLK